MENKPSSNKKLRPSKQAIKKAFQLFSYIKPHALSFFLGVIFLMLSSATNLAFPYLTGNLVDSIEPENINGIALTLLAIFVAGAIFSFLRIYLFEIVAQKSMANLRTDLYNHLISLPMTFFSSQRVGELNSRISNDISQLQTTLSSTSAQFIRQIIIIIGGVTMISTISWKLTFFMLAVIPVLAVISVIFGRFIKRLSKQTQKALAESTTIIDETLQGIAVVKAYANEWFEAERYSKKLDNVISIALKNAVYRGAFISFIFFSLFGSIVGVLWYGLNLRQTGEITDGNLFSFVLYTVFIGASFGGIAEIYAQIVRAIGASEQVFLLMEEDAERINIKNKPNYSNAFSGNIKFENVSFSYPSRKEVQVLNKVSFQVSNGEKVALVGPSGAGKSTIASLILRFYDSDEGVLSIDNKTIESYQLSILRSNIGIVPQEVILFGGSIKENIAYGNLKATDAEIINAAEQANAMEFINGFPDKINTIVGERGIQLSGGQRQRIAIARAILKDPQILILDEATSALDSESEKLVQDALERLLEGRTSIIIAHRLSTIKNVDRIVVLSQGEVKESGNHDELLANDNSYYKEVLSMQLS